MAREADTYALGATQFFIPAGATNALLVLPEWGEVSHTIKWVSGGSLEIQHPPLGPSYAAGQTWMGASLAALGTGNGWILGTTEADNVNGPARYYLMATGSTAVAYKLIAYSQNV